MDDVELSASTCTYRWTKSSYDHNYKIVEEIETSESISEDDPTPIRPPASALEIYSMAPLLAYLKLKLLENAKRINEMQNFIQDLVNIGQQSINGHEIQHKSLDIGVPALRTLPKDARDRLKAQIMARKERMVSLVKKNEELRSVLDGLRESLFVLGQSTKLVHREPDDCKEKEPKIIT